MTNLKLLNEEIKKSGKTITHLSKIMGISREGLYKKLNGETEFKVSEASLIVNELNLDNELKTKIFFANESE